MTPERYQKIGALFGAAKRLPPGERSGFLAQACGADEALHREVESLLGYDDQTDNFIDLPALQLSAESLSLKPEPDLSGRQVDHYEIVSLLGRGGMGEVYRARDSRLDREVAIKILPAAYSSDADRLRRFEQEARAAGRLNHPNVLTVYDVGVYQGAPYIVTELLEGHELRTQLKQGAVAQRRALQYAQQIANGLAAAHAKDIVHRDLKPENIFITSDGRLKILDFGLAKLKAPVSTKGSDDAHGFTTKPGIVMGTVGYMAPEQIRGQETDGRADVFALGVILYEMLGGRAPFSGESDVELMNAILKEDPPELTEANGDIPRVLASIVQRCLEKNAEQRFQSASDLAFALETSSSVFPAPDIAAKAIPRSVSTRRLRWLSLVAVLVVAGGFIAWRLQRSDYWWRNPLVNAQFTPLTDFPESERSAAISRDGKFVAFISDRDGPFDVWAGQIGTGEFQNVTQGRAPDIGNPRVRNLGFSPDGSQLTLEVRIMGRVYAAERGVHCHYLAWSQDGAFIYFVRGFPPDEMDIWRIKPTGESLEQITFHNSFVAYPTLLNERMLFYIARGDNGTGPWLYGMDVERRLPHRISLGVEQYTSIATSADGRRLVATVANPDAGLWRVPISDQTVEESAARRISLPTVRGLSPRTGPGYMLYLSSKGGNDGIWKFGDATAVELWSGSHGRVQEGATISPDGQRIAFTAQKEGRNRLYLMNSNGTGVTELASSLNVRGAPAWPPVGEWLTLAADQGKTAGLYKVPLDGEPPIQLIGEQAANPVWSPDGRFVVFSGVEVGTTFPLKAATADGKPYDIPELVLSRGANRFSFLPGRPVLVVLKGDVWHKNFWLIDLVTGRQRQLTNFSREFLISDFDVSPDGKEIVFSRVKENSNIVLIDITER
ncbi:MAG TPA: protein kinase [Terriglobia bacterium]|nr:protein kinase [Terriglobia bacterium]